MPLSTAPALTIEGARTAGRRLRADRRKRGFDASLCAGRGGIPCHTGRHHLGGGPGGDDPRQDQRGKRDGRHRDQNIAIGIDRCAFADQECSRPLQRGGRQFVGKIDSARALARSIGRGKGAGICQQQRQRRDRTECHVTFLQMPHAQMFLVNTPVISNLRQRGTRRRQEAGDRFMAAAFVRRRNAIRGWNRTRYRAGAAAEYLSVRAEE